MPIKNSAKWNVQTKLHRQQLPTIAPALDFKWFYFYWREIIMKESESTIDLHMVSLLERVGYPSIINYLAISLPTFKSLFTNGVKRGCSK